MSRGSWAWLNATTSLAAFACGVAAADYFGWLPTVLVAGFVGIVTVFVVIFLDSPPEGGKPSKPWRPA